MKTMRQWALTVLLALALALMPACATTTASHDTTQPKETASSAVLEPSEANVAQEENSEQGADVLAASSFDLASIPAYSGSASVEVNGGVPFFTESDFTTNSYESYAPLDSLGRCGVAVACIGMDIMPTEERGSIGEVKPTGWHLVKYDWVDGKYLYNRCHLIGYQLAGENANERNLITGTRYLNVEGMLPFENTVAHYVESTGNHVLYRVTPVFEGSNLLASGVLMEARSVEDDGAGVQFCVWCYNVQPGVGIDYATGDNWDDGTQGAAAGSAEAALAAAGATASSQAASYVLNTNSKKFHYPSCSSVNTMSAANRQDFTGSRDEVIAMGYDPCKRCNP